MFVLSKLIEHIQLVSLFLLSLRHLFNLNGLLATCFLKKSEISIALVSRDFADTVVVVFMIILRIYIFSLINYDLNHPSLFSLTVSTESARQTTETTEHKTFLEGEVLSVSKQVKAIGIIRSY